MSSITKPELEKILQDCLNRLAGEKAPKEWKPGDNVILCWGLDSEHGIELACDLETTLGIPIPLKENPLVNDDTSNGKKTARTYEEVVDYLISLAS